jgi:adenosylcobalamin-dependent ribonucleoside-triphosphate reductase
MGVNPCGEIGLPDRATCNLVETFPSRHESFDDFKRTLKYAYLYGKSVTLIPTHCERTNQVIMRQRRIGLSQSGIVEAIKKLGMAVYLKWCDRGYDYLGTLDTEYSNWLCIPRSVKMTTVKPSGSLSLLPGVTPGIHYPHSEYYIRRIRIDSTSPLVKILEKAGYILETSVCGDNTLIASIPVKSENFIEGKEQISMWKQLELGAKLQYYWSDNSVSQTVTVRPDELSQISSALEFYEDRLKTVSFLPLKDHKYVQAPYEEITKETYESLVATLRPLKFKRAQVHDSEEKYCDGEGCLLNADSKEKR